MHHIKKRHNLRIFSTEHMFSLRRDDLKFIGFSTNGENIFGGVLSGLGCVSILKWLEMNYLAPNENVNQNLYFILNGIDW